MTNISQELIVKTFPCLSDNYGFLIHDPVSQETACVDTPDADAINQQLDQNGWSLTYIFNTHHHWDHIGGNEALKKQHRCQIIASNYDKDRVPGIDRTVREGDIVTLGDHEATIYETPGHTLGHIIYHFQKDKLLFVGDTLFSLGCGRLFEGSAEQMFHSLNKLKAFPEETIVHCAHEYTEANGHFALSVEENNPALQKRFDKVKTMRQKDIATVPFKLGEDITTNPFLLASNVDEFAERRRLKDNF